MLKNIKDFYQTKGSEKSYELLFRLLYDSACDFYYPKQDMLRVSDGQWTEEQAIKVTSSNGTKNFKIANTKIEQINSGTNKVDATARCYRVHQYNIGPHEVTELFINNIVGEFKSGETLKCTLSDDTEITEIIYGLFSDLEIINRGRGYAIGDKAKVDERVNKDEENIGEGGSGKVLDVSLKGEIKGAVVDNGGVNYVEPIRVIFEGGDGTATATMNPKALISYPGYYKNNNGKLSSNKKIQDGHYYQDYSYVLKAEISLDMYKDILKKIIHPAGLKVFGAVSIMKEIQSDQPFHCEHQAYEMPIVGHYTPYRSLSTTDLRSNGVTSPASGPGSVHGWSGAASTYATATIIGTAALDDEDGTNFILRNTDGSTVTFHTDPTKNFGDTSSDGGDHTWIVNTRDINSVRKATQALYISCKTAIDAGELDMTIFPTTVTPIADETQANFTLTQTAGGTASNTSITLITGVEEVNGETTFTGGSENGNASATGDLYFFGYNPGSTTDYHCYGDTGGKLIVRGPSLTAGSFPVGLQVIGDTSGASGEVISWDVYQGTAGMTIGVMHLRSTPEMRPNGWCGPAGGEFGELISVTSGTGGGGWTAELLTILEGNGIVSELLTDGTTLAGLIQHDTRKLPLGTAGADGYTAAQDFYRRTGLAGICAGATAYNYWEIYHHPNTRGFSGQYVAGGWTLGIDSGMSFDRVPLKTFLKMAVGMHFHSDPSSDSLYYGGSSSDSNNYSVPYGSTSGSPNLTHI